MKAVLFDCIKKEKPNSSALGAFNSAISNGKSKSTASSLASKAAKEISQKKPIGSPSTWTDSQIESVVNSNFRKINALNNRIWRGNFIYQGIETINGVRYINYISPTGESIRQRVDTLRIT